MLRSVTLNLCRNKLNMRRKWPTRWNRQSNARRIGTYTAQKGVVSTFLGFHIRGIRDHRRVPIVFSYLLSSPMVVKWASIVIIQKSVHNFIFQILINHPISRHRVLTHARHPHSSCCMWVHCLFRACDLDLLPSVQILLRKSRFLHNPSPRTDTAQQIPTHLLSWRASCLLQNQPTFHLGLRRTRLDNFLGPLFGHVFLTISVVPHESRYLPLRYSGIICWT